MDPSTVNLENFEAWHSLPAFGVVLFFIWLLMNLKTSRPDGKLIKTHRIRKMMSYIMKTRNESVVYFDSYVEADKLLAYIEKARKRFHCDVTHAVVGAVYAAIFSEAGRKMNRFTVGRRLYERDGIWVSFSMKRKKLNREAKLAVVKLRAEEGESFEGLCTRIADKIGVERSDTVTYADKEIHLLTSIPRPLLNWGVSFFQWLDYHNCLPHSFIVNDAMYTSVFVANLGSLNMGAGYHHLYEWGTCPLFLMLGKIEKMPVVEGDELVVKPMLHIRYSYDERIDDGLTARSGIEAMKTILEDPDRFLGSVQDDGSDAFAINEGPAARLVPIPGGGLEVTEG